MSRRPFQPFHGVFGTTPELLVVEYIMPLRGVEFSPDEVSRYTGLELSKVMEVLSKLESYRVIRVTHRDARGNPTYATCPDSPYAILAEAFDEFVFRIRSLGSMQKD